MSVQIPIYRAKKIDSDEYVQGNLVNDRDGYYIFDVRFFPASTMPMEKFIEIDPLTLAIHFPDMLDKNGNKIFASLSEDGIGGDDYNRWHGKSGWIMHDGITIFDISAGSDTSDFEVTGIYEGETNDDVKD